MNDMENKMIYSLGVRDGIASVLMQAKFDGVRLPKVAMDYEKSFGEHPTLKWHTEAKEGEGV